MAVAAERRSTLLLETFRRFCRSKLAIAGSIIIFIIVIAALFAPLISPYDPRDTNLRISLNPPSKEHIMGTDTLGRDIFSRIVYGARISLIVGIVAVLIALVIGLIFGALSGYYGGWVDHIIMRFTDIVFAFPTALFAIAVAAVFERRSISTLFWILGLIGWAGIARIVRGKVLELKGFEFTEAARALGGRDFRIIFKHILPNSFAPIMVAASIGIAGNILTEAWLSFLGLGLEASQPSWGNMINEGRAVLTNKPWVCIFPGLAIMTAVLGFNLLGDGLRDILDPRLKNI